MKLAELLKGLDYTCTAGLNITIDDIVYDSRKTGPGRVFVCLKGSNTDGHAFAAQAARAGAAAIVAEDKIEAAGAPVVYVPSTRLALAAMSATLFRHPTRELLMVGITGTKGKTTCAYMVRSI
ncbi:MAG: Mur ligase domain-containing protein [Hydrogeniiclostridium mannosilyticum]